MTKTIGIRRQLVQRSLLKREQVTVIHEGKSYRVKIVERPAGASAKVEIDDLEYDEALREIIEQVALQQHADAHE